ncbi:DNA-3-methyladenine glycosylase 2 family protein [Herpetosiphon geysericola]|uniref:DNA-3-methyladenine glycosylase II n=1 Tax=Herpetosiphon geysericola TaxID=70996 RepID=A0A0P6XDZ6_9CHLR|nr:DNA-3-methyladenine glycosylase 2 [Herpetosiphon geysericola]KPL81175.1 hypothetical protein SE18_20980 [Herpetosiphon geysericola]
MLTEIEPTLPSHSDMVAHMLQSDASYNGKFITAVKTTGIYCLPSCRARKPKPENVEFFHNPNAAQGAGYRACKLCRPDDFYRGFDPEEHLTEQLIESVLAQPAAFGDVKAMAQAAGVGQTKLFELMRVYYHTTPADLLLHGRIEAACALLLNSDQTIIAIANEVGFDSLSSFNENFRKQTLLTPSDYRRMPETGHFSLSLPNDYPSRQILGQLGRDPLSLTDRVVEQTWLSTCRLNAQTGVLLSVTITQQHAECSIVDQPTLTPSDYATIHQHIVAGLGLRNDPSRFEAHVAKSPALLPLIEQQRGLRMPLVHNPFDALVWAILGQQISLAVAYRLRQRLTALVGQPLNAEFYLAPTPSAVAELSVEQLLPLGFSNSKARYLIDTAQAIVAGTLPLASYGSKSATRIERELLALRGIGPWTAQYVLMRSYGFSDCVPVGDSGLTSSLQAFFQLEQRPDRSTTLALMAAFSPYRSLATFHLWQRLKPM